METVVYADVLWLIDFSMDLLALGLAGRMTQRPTRPVRIGSAATLGGLWSVAAVILSLDGLVGFALSLAVAALLLLIAFGRCSPTRFALTLGAFLLASLLLGGSMTALANLFAPAQHEDISGGSFFLLALGGSAVTVFGTYLRRRAAPRRTRIAVTYAGRSMTLDALCDSGNLVRDPVSGRGVIFIDPARLGELLDDSLCRVLRSGRIEGMQALEPDVARRLCLVPAATVQGRGMLLALRPDGVMVGNEPCAALICPMREASRDCEAILPADLAPPMSILGGKRT